MNQHTRFLWLAVLWLNLAAWPAAGAVAQKRNPANGSSTPPRINVQENLTKWKELNSVEGRFAILFPGMPTEETQAVGTEDAPLEVHSYTLRKASAEFAVAYVDYPIPVNNLIIAGQVLDNVAAAELEEADGAASSIAEIALDGHPGRFLKLTLPDGRLLHNKMYMVGRRLYQITFTQIAPAPTKDAPPPPLPAPPAVQLHDAAAAAKFFDSFKLPSADKKEQ